MSKDHDGIVIHQPHAGWLAYLMEQPHFEVMIKNLQEDQPNCIFNHEGMAQQTKVMIGEQIVNLSKRNAEAEREN